jgi:hypothetical protein
MQDYEKLGAFYLGRQYDTEKGKPTEDLLLYDSRDLTTHAVCVGMTGSGKTGLCLALLEEAAIDGVPAIAIDPKGDLGNLMLTFPELRLEDFLPWVDSGDAMRKGLTPPAYAAQTAEQWRQGLAEWGQDAARIQRLRSAADVAIYTPGSSAGLPLTVLRSFAAPPPAVAADSTAMRDRVLSAVSGLLGLLGVPADPVQSREHILISNILDRAWRAGTSLDIAAIIQQIQKPPFDKIGVFDLETFFPAKDRLTLAMMLNNLLASPGFAAWMEGDPLDIQRLLYTPEGKPRIAILSIAHLSEAERMFFVTILLNEVVAWMRQQSGSSSLRALLYMDEIFGYFPPTAVPPSKPPMLTLLKQARAYGLGVVLATQNPVDLDYKGLANTGTWFIGRLQTERDKMRVIEGLEGAAAATGGAFDRSAVEALLAGLGNRVFLMRNVHDDEPVVFQSRWALCYLRGPLTIPQIQQLTQGKAGAAPAAAPLPRPAPPVEAASPAPSAPRPVVPSEAAEVFFRPAGAVAAGAGMQYVPSIYAESRVHFVDTKADVDAWQTCALLAPLSPDGNDVLWTDAERLETPPPRDSSPVPGARFGELPTGAARAKNYGLWQKTLASHIYQNVTLDLFACPELELTSRPGETEGDFRARLAHRMREERDLALEKLRQRYAPQLAALQERVRRAEERVAREKSQVTQQTIQTAISVGATVLGALFGRKIASVGNVGRAATAMRGAGRTMREREDVGLATESLSTIQQQLAELQTRFEGESAALQQEADTTVMTLVKSQIRPRKSDITVTAVSLAWVP